MKRLLLLALLVPSLSLAGDCKRKFGDLVVIHEKKHRHSEDRWYKDYRGFYDGLQGIVVECGFYEYKVQVRRNGIVDNISLFHDDIVESINNE